MRWAARDQHMPPGQGFFSVVLARQQTFDCLDEVRHFEQATWSRLAALCHFADGWSGKVDTVGLQQRDVALGRLVQPHAGVHRRGDKHRFVSCEKHRRREIIGVATGHLCQ